MSTATVQPVVETRSGPDFQVAEVNFPKRIVTVIAMPYESPTEQALVDGRVVTEVVSRGAFNGVERRASQIKANRDHSWAKPVGKTVALHPSRAEGLVAEVKIAKGTLGQETMDLCEDGILGASAGFRLLCQGGDGSQGPVYPDAEVWERNPTVRRLNRLYLDHLAFVANPAYQDAAVLSLRNVQDALSGDPAEDSTPNRDRLAYETLRAQMDELDRRWLRQ